MLARRGLRAGVGDHAVPEQLERDPGLRGDRPAYVQIRRVVHGSVADVLDEVRAIAERREPDPGQAFAAELGHRVDVTLGLLNDLVDAVAAGRPEGDLFGCQDSAGAVRATRAEVGCPGGEWRVVPRLH